MMQRHKARYVRTLTQLIEQYYRSLEAGDMGIRW